MIYKYTMDVGGECLTKYDMMTTNVYVDNMNGKGFVVAISVDNEAWESWLTDNTKSGRIKIYDRMVPVKQMVKNKFKEK